MSPTTASALNDPRGQRLGTASRAAADATEQALWRMMSYYDVPLADLDAAIAHDPAWALPRVMKAGFLLSLTEPSRLEECAALIEGAQPLARAAPLRERTHLEAVRAVCEGRWHHACKIWDTLLLDHPRDALALQWAHLWDFYRGDANALRRRPARALPEWDHADVLYPYVLALHAFGLEECNLYAMAEEAGRRALTYTSKNPWAVHAVAHAMEMQGRFDEGAVWLRQTQGDWAEGNGFATHLWWHLALFRLEALDDVGVLRLVDTHLSSEVLQSTLQRLDAAALLWRLKLLGLDVLDRFRALVEGWNVAPEREAGHCAFNDAHVMLALLGAEEPGRAENWLARCAQRAMEAEDARRANHAMAREVGLPLMRALLAFARGDMAFAADQLYAVRSVASSFGGSHAQRDVIDQTIFGAAAQGGRTTIARAVFNERQLAKPSTPLSRHWGERIGVLGLE